MDDYELYRVEQFKCWYLRRYDKYSSVTEFIRVYSTDDLKKIRDTLIEAVGLPDGVTKL